jgi:hypothetical protein
MVAAECPGEQCFPYFMPFLGGPHRNIKPGFYCIVMKARWFRWVGHVAHLGKKKSTEF